MRKPADCNPLARITDSHSEMNTMRRLLPFLIALIILTGSWFVSDAQAQFIRRTRGDDDKPGRAPPVAPYAVAVVTLFTTLIIVCAPSRKGDSSSDDPEAMRRKKKGLPVASMAKGSKGKPTQL